MIWKDGEREKEEKRERWKEDKKGGKQRDENITLSLSVTENTI